MRIPILLLLFAGSVFSTKIVLFCLEVSGSQTIWNKRVAETLATQKENDVTLVIFRVFRDEKSNIQVDKSVKVKVVDADGGFTKGEMDGIKALSTWEDLPIWDSRETDTINMMMKIMRGSCEMLLKNKDFLEWLKAERFDIAFTHMFDACPIGLIHYAKIPSWVWLNSGLLMDFVADSVGVPLLPSYIPPMMMQAHSKMSFPERVKSFIGHGITKIVYPRFAPNAQTALFRKYISPDFPDLMDLSRECPLVMVNSNELYELARPTLHKVINIGGLGMQFKDAKPLPQKYESIMNSGKGVILMSFGSVALPSLMPQQWKTSLMEAFGRFPDYEFIYYYDGDDMHSYKPKNVHLFKWIPQSDLLKNPKTLGIITHGGYNTVQESLVSGKPMITIPLFGDQYKNAKTAEYLGYGINIPKSNITADSVESAIRRMVEDKKYGQVAQRIAQMVRKQAIKPDELLIKWTAFLAEFKTLENLVPYGTKLNFIEYHSLDVIVFLTLSLYLVLYIIVKSIIFIAGKAYGWYLTTERNRTKKRE